MTPQRWQQIEELYHAARESGDAVLDGADPDIRDEVEKLLAQDSTGGDKLLDYCAADLITDFPDTEIAPGTTLGPYKIEAMIGRGGMGQVFRATDTRLGRRVAIKLSRARFIAGFEYEARSIAAINHPHVCTLHDVGPNYLVMELVEGETLAARLKRGKLSIAETILFGSQIADALAAAHAKDIVHRDLKPSNIMLTRSGVKVLDFGIAKSALDPGPSAAKEALGTPEYMAPEQSQGKEADTRSDIYALGLVLSQMLTLKLSAHPENLPLSVERVIKRCLETDPDERWQSARDLKWELESAAYTATVPSSRGRMALLAPTLAFATLLLAVLVVLQFFARSPAQQEVRANIPIPEKSRVLSLALSPDGRALAMVLVKDGKQQIWIRTLDALEPVALAGTDNAVGPFWSPDSRFIAFFADDKLKRIDRAGGPVQTLSDAHAVVGGTWSRKGEILLGGLFRVERIADNGGPFSHVPGQQAYWPVFLPDGEHYLATNNSIWLRSTKGPEERRILPDVSNVQVVERLPGRRVGGVLFTRASTLMVLPFDWKRLEPAGEPFSVARGIAATNSGWLAAASSSGVLAYVSGHEGADLARQMGQWHFVWRNRKGAYLGSFGDAGGTATLSPNGRLLTTDWNSEIAVLDLATGVATPLTFPPSWGQNPIWSSDGKYVAWNNNTGIFRRLATGAGEEELLVKNHSLVVPKGWSPNGGFLLYAQVNANTGADLLGMAVDGDRKPFVLAQNCGQGQFSPNGHWAACTCNESGRSEIYVNPFPPSPNGGRWMVSRGGGVMPRWRSDGKELYYISPDSEMMGVQVDTGPVFHAGNPQPLFQTEIVDTGIRSGPMSWDVTHDGKRFLIISAKSQDAGFITLVLNWRADQQ